MKHQECSSCHALFKVSRLIVPGRQQKLCEPCRTEAVKVPEKTMPRLRLVGG